MLPTIATGNVASAIGGGYAVDNSCRFDDGSSDKLSKTQSTGNQRTYTFSFWIKRQDLERQQFMFGARYSNLTRYAWILFNNESSPDKDRLNIKSGIYSTSSTSTSMAFTTTRVFRDTSAWYHIVIAVDTTQGTESDRVKIYVNGVQETSFTTSTYPSQNDQHFFNVSTTTLEIGAFNSADYFSGYMAETVLIDGLQLTPTDFGEFNEDSGIWKPIDVSGLTFGTNGFYLDFKDSANLGNDANGGTDLTEANLTAIDQTTDTPTNNFATINALDNFYFGGTLSEGNLKILSIAGVESYITSTIAVSTGKWYWEIKITASGSARDFVGIADKIATASNYTPYSGNSKVLSYYGFTGQSVAGSTGNSGTPYGATFTTGDIIGVAMDLDNNKLYFSKNGTFQNSGDPTSGATGTGALAIDSSPADGVYYAQFANIHNTASTFEANFGNAPYAISSGNADADGYGNFEYSVPSGYYALCTKNLAEYG